MGFRKSQAFFEKKSENILFPRDRLVDVSKSGKLHPWRLMKSRSQRLSSVYSNLACGSDSGADFERFSSKSSRVNWCSYALDFNIDASGEKKLSNGHFCRVRLCPVCAWRRSLKIQGQSMRILSKEIENHPDYEYIFLTLTVRNCRGHLIPGDALEPLPDVLSRMFKAWNVFTGRKMFKDTVKGWFRGLEITHNINPGSGVYYNSYHPHFHCLLAVPGDYFKRHYIPARPKFARLAFADFAEFRALCRKKGLKAAHFRRVRVIGRVNGKFVVEYDTTGGKNWLDLWCSAYGDYTISQVDVRKVGASVDSCRGDVFSQSRRTGASVSLAPDVSAAVAESSLSAYKSRRDVLSDVSGSLDYTQKVDFSAYLAPDGEQDSRSLALEEESVRDLDFACDHRRFAAYGGDFKILQKELNLDDVEDGTLEDTHEEDEAALKLLATERYFWFTGCRDYVRESALVVAEKIPGQVSAPERECEKIAEDARREVERVLRDVSAVPSSICTRARPVLPRLRILASLESPVLSVGT